MKKIFDFGRDLYCYHAIANNGLNVYLVPNKRRKDVSAHVAIKFGGMNYQYIKNNQTYNLPTGLAHFLEHQMFNQPDGVDVLEAFEKMGASANAWTSEKYTHYYFQTAVNFEDNLKTLIELINQPSFKRKSVLNERKIIVQEYNMHADNPLEKAYYKLLNNIYHVYSVKTNILGSKRDIKRTTPENLYNAYENFYHANNMVIVIVGNFESQKALSIINEAYRVPSGIASPLLGEEPLTVVKKRSIIYGPVNVSKLLLGYKLALPQTNTFKSLLSLEILNNILFGRTSEFIDYNNQYNLVKAFNTGISVNGNQILWLFEGSSNDCQKLLTKIKSVIVTENLDIKAFERIKNKMIAHIYRSLDYNKVIANVVFTEIFEYGQINDAIATLQNLSFAEFKNILQSFSFNHYSYVIIKPKK